MIFADTSFVVALFAASDSHNRNAWKLWQNLNCPIVISTLVLFEAENAIRGFQVTGKLSEEGCMQSLQGIKLAGASGLFQLKDQPMKRLIPEARRLSPFHTNDAIYGALDILHVASGLTSACDEFFTFDRRQAQLAISEGLICPVTIP